MARYFKLAIVETNQGYVRILAKNKKEAIRKAEACEYDGLETISTEAVVITK